jgi:protocatechuate 3,4-dioxygenase beta subunit
MRRPVRRAAVLGLGLALLGLVAGLLWKGEPSAPGAEAAGEASPRASREAVLPGRAPMASTPPAPGALSLRGVVRDARGPVAGAVVLATAVDPQETLSELPREKGGLRGLSTPQDVQWYAPESALFMRHVAAREGDVLVLARTTSAADGSFLLEGLGPGTVTLWADSPRGAAVLPEVPSGQQDASLVLTPGHHAEGLVVGRDEGPLPGVLVTAIHLSLGRFFDTVTDAQGMFRFEPLPPGEYFLVFTKQGWLPEFFSLRDLYKYQAQTVLERPRRISGRVLQGGAPAASARVQLTDHGYHWETRTDAQGRFAFEELRESNYVLLAEKESALALQTLSFQREAMEGLTLELSPPSFLEGTVSDETGHPVAGAQVATIDPGREFAGQVTTDARGRYRLGPLAKGSYRVIVHADSYLDGFAMKNLPEDSSTLDFQLKKSVPVVGVAVDTEGQPLPHLALQLWSPGKRGTSYILGHHRHPAMPVDSVKTDERGAFQLSAPASGPYELNTDSDEVRFTSMTVVAPAQEVRLVVSRGLSLEGVLVDEAGQPVQGAQVLCVDAAPPYNARDPRVRTNEAGRFLLPALSEGTYVIYAWFEGDKTLREASTRVTLPRSLSGPIQLRFEPGHSWTGRVEDPQGRPLAGVSVILDRAEDPSEPEADNALMMAVPGVSTVSGPDGRFTFHHLTRAAYELELDKPGYVIVSPRNSAAVSENEFTGNLTVRVTAGELRFVLEKDEEDEGEP